MGLSFRDSLLVGADLVATMHEGLARLLSSMWPQAIKPCPIAVPPMQQAIQWHKYRTQDRGIVWRRSLFRQAAAVLPPAHRP